MFLEAWHYCIVNVSGFCDMYFLTIGHEGCVYLLSQRSISPMHESKWNQCDNQVHRITFCHPLLYLIQMHVRLIKDRCA